MTSPPIPRERVVMVQTPQGFKYAVLRHAFRNSLIPIVTLLGLQFGAVLTGFLFSVLPQLTATPTSGVDQAPVIIGGWLAIVTIIQNPNGIGSIAVLQNGCRACTGVFTDVPSPKKHERNNPSRSVAWRRTAFA